jgi:transcriptional regulator with XRE-family HTH domain
MKHSKASADLDALLKRNGRGAHARLARSLGVAASTITGWRNGSRAPVTELRIRLAPVLGGKITDWDKPGDLGINGTA